VKVSVRLVKPPSKITELSPNTNGDTFSRRSVNFTEDGH
jgi:hypothetical protein